MNITIEKSKHGFLAFGEGIAFFAPTRIEAAQGLILEAEKLPQDDGMEYAELTDIISAMYGVLKHPELRTNVTLNLQIKPMRIQTEESSMLALQVEMKGKLDKASLGLSAISAAVSDHLTGKKQLIILQKS